MHVYCVLLPWILVTCAILCGSHGNIVMMLKIIVSSFFFCTSGRTFNPQTMVKKTGELQSILGKPGEMKY